MPANEMGSKGSLGVWGDSGSAAGGFEVAFSAGFSVGMDAVGAFLDVAPSTTPHESIHARRPTERAAAVFLGEDIRS